jgi:hypothetical protein
MTRTRGRTDRHGSGPRHRRSRGARRPTRLFGRQVAFELRQGWIGAGIGIGSGGGRCRIRCRIRCSIRCSRRPAAILGLNVLLELREAAGLLLVVVVFAVLLVVIAVHGDRPLSSIRFDSMQAGRSRVGEESNQVTFDRCQERRWARVKSPESSQEWIEWLGLRRERSEFQMPI